MFLVAVFFLVTPVLGNQSFLSFSLRSSELVKTSLTSLYNKFRFFRSSGFCGATQRAVNIGEVGSNDARPEIIRQYLYYYNSPLIPYADLIVQTATNTVWITGLLLPSPNRKSNLCKSLHQIL